MGTTLITGATGFVGAGLVESVDGPIVVLSRNPEKAQAALRVARAFEWRPEKGPPPTEALDDADVIFHLAGESVVGRWTKAKKDKIRDSRVLGTRHLVEGLRRAKVRPRVLLTASAVGYYGERADEELSEGSPPGQGFLTDVCVGWEDEARTAEELGVRVVMLRIGFVLGPGGALAKMLPAFRMGAGGRIGSGKQWMPWVHRDDVVGLARWAAERPVISRRRAQSTRGGSPSARDTLRSSTPPAEVEFGRYHQSLRERGSRYAPVSRMATRMEAPRARAKGSWPRRAGRSLRPAASRRV